MKSNEAVWPWNWETLQRLLSVAFIEGMMLGTMRSELAIAVARDSAVSSANPYFHELAARLCQLNRFTAVALRPYWTVEIAILLEDAMESAVACGLFAVASGGNATSAAHRAAAVMARLLRALSAAGHPIPGHADLVSELEEVTRR